MKSRRDIKMKTKRYHPKITHPLAFLKPTFKDKPPHSTGSSGHVSRKSSLKLHSKKTELRIDRVIVLHPFIREMVGCSKDKDFLKSTTKRANLVVRLQMGRGDLSVGSRSRK